MSLDTPAILFVVEAELTEDELEALNKCECAMCKRMRAERQASNLVLVHLDSEPAMRSVGRRRPLSRKSKTVLKSTQFNNP